MKKSALIVVVISIAVAAAAAGVFFSVVSKSAAIETILPADPVFFVKFSEVDRQVKEFKASKLCRNIEKIDIETLMEKSGAKKEQVESFTSARTELTSFIGGLVLEKYFGKEIAVAVYPSNIALVTRVKPETKFIDFLAKIFNKAGRKYEVIEENYKGRKMTVIKLDDKASLAYVQIKDMLVIGFGKKAAISCCDVADKKFLSLAQDKDYTSAMSKFPKGADTVAFGDIGLMISGIKRIAESIPMPAAQESTQPDPRQAFQAQINKSLGMYDGFKTFSYAKYPGKIAKERMLVSLDRSKLIPFFKSFYSVKPRKNAALKLAPASAIYYDWGTFEWKSYWKYIKEEISNEAAKANQGPTFNDMISGFEKQIGMSIENDLVPALGDEIGVCLTDINLEGMIPMPQFIVFVKVDKKETIDRLLGQFTQGGKSDLQSEAYKGADIKYINLPFGLAFQPAFCYVGDYFLFSLGRDPIKGSIDSYSGTAKSLFESEDFKAVNNGLMDPANKVCFVKVDTLLQKGKGLCDWAVRWLTLMSEQQKKYKDMMATQTDKLQADIQALEKELADIKAKRSDPAVTPEAAAELDARIEEKGSMLTMDKEQLDQFQMRGQQGGLRQDPMSNFDAALVQLWLEKAVYPVIDGLQPLKAVGSKTVFTDNAIQTETFSKIVE
jgi:hypothetical protein